MPTTPKDILVRTIMQGSTGLPEDRYVNDFAFRYVGLLPPTNAQLLLLFGAVDGFFNDVQAGGNRVSHFIGEAVNRAVTHEMEFVDISIGGSPRLSEPWLGPAVPIFANNNLPTEVAGVLSFHGNLTGIPEEVGATRPKARRRGRLYIGPLITASVAFATANPFLNGSFTTCLRQAAGAMQDEAAASLFEWSVWSRANNELYQVVGGWTDNAPDTQRRRGIESTARVTFIV